MQDIILVSHKASTLIGSEIIKLGNDINRRIAEGQPIYNLTIGDFNPKLFPIPDLLLKYILEAYQSGETNYPVADGMPVLKEAILNFVNREEEVDYSMDEIVIAGGGRPLIYGIYEALIDPGDKVVYPVPSWNNNHYCHLLEAEKIEIPTRPEDGFMPTAEELAPHLGDAALLALCSPLNPTGTIFNEDELARICDLVLEENRRREGVRKPLYVLYDQMYWMLMAAGMHHVNPVSVRPEMKPYTLFVDGISKSLAATGVRVGWGLGPASIIAKMKSIISHVGAWSPRAEQIATARFMSDDAAVRSFEAEFGGRINRRFQALYEGFEKLRNKGLPVMAIKPQGAIYVSVQFDLQGRTTKAGKTIDTTEDITSFLLDKAQLALVPFTAFGCEAGTNWFRLSVGTLPEEEIPNLLQKLEQALMEIS